MSDESLNIAMWSGPRNLSTAMMYSFAQRADCEVIDEPYYAAYLNASGIKHAMYKEIIDDGEVDPTRVAESCVQQGPKQQKVFYQKHMTKHMLHGFDLDWLTNVTNVFLIREPQRVIASYHAKQENPVLSDIGVKEQLDIFERVCQETGEIPTVIDSTDILLDPKNMIAALCLKLGIDFQQNMLQWKAGPRSFDGIWAPHWYKSVWQSTGFAKPENKKIELPEHLLEVLEVANGYYRRLKSHAIAGSS